MSPQQAWKMPVGAGADPNRVMIGHIDGDTDVSYYIATLEYGVNIAFDRFGIQGIVGARWTPCARRASSDSSGWVTVAVSPSPTTP